MKTTNLDIGHARSDALTKMEDIMNEPTENGLCGRDR